MRFLSELVRAAIVFSLLIPPSAIFASTDAADSAAPCRKELATGAATAVDRGVLDEILTADSAGSERSEKAALARVEGDIHAHLQKIAALRSEVAAAEKETSKLRDEERGLQTDARIHHARAQVFGSQAEARDAIEFATAQLGKIQFCENDLVEKQYRDVTSCVFWHADRALSKLSLVLVPIIIAYTNETLGRDERTRKAMDEARQAVQDEIDIAKVDQRRVDLSGDAWDTMASRLEIRALELQRWLKPFLAGLGSTLVNGVVGGVRMVVPKKAEPGAAPVASVNPLFRAKEFTLQMGANIWKTLSSLNFREMRSNAYLVKDYVERFAWVAIASVVVNTVKSFKKHGTWPQAVNTPWHLVANAATMMLIQQEISARNTQVHNNVVAAKDFSELMARIPGVVAGKQGMIHEAWNRFTGFFAGVPAEFPFLAAWTWAYHGYVTDKIDPLSWEGLSTSAGDAVGFLSSFGVYLILKWSLWAKTFELGFIPEYRAMTEQPYEALRVTLAKQYGIPVTKHKVTDPTTHEEFEIE
ncbi:hypothetical protein K2X33_00930, partial [bacterium]|nr:hypothetical protein [bacterium]